MVGDDSCLDALSKQVKDTDLEARKAVRAALSDINQRKQNGSSYRSLKKK